MNYKMIIAGAVAGLLTAIGVDVDAWAKSEGPFEWKLAVKRWVAGLVAGAAAGATMAGAQ